LIILAIRIFGQFIHISIHVAVTMMTGIIDLGITLFSIFT
jgi:hypothetical protein